MAGTIGIFDSGFGGLHVLRGIVKELPQYDYLYLGDNRRAPYGPRSAQEVLQFTQEGVDFLFAHGAEVVVVACNTASSEALRVIQSTAERKVLGVLIPFAEVAVEKSNTKRIGVIATEGTVRSGSYEREILKLAPDAQVFCQACPRLVPLVEAGEENSELAKRFLGEYLHGVLTHDIDTLVLGCTHYGILEPHIARITGPDIHLVSEREVMARKLREYFAHHVEIETRLAKGGTVSLYTTGSTQTFAEIGSRFFGTPVQAHFAQLGVENASAVNTEA